MIILLALVLPAKAGRWDYIPVSSDPCEAFKPVQQMTTQEEQSIEASVQGRIRATVDVGGNVSDALKRESKVVLEDPDEITRQRKIFGVCKLYQSGLITLEQWNTFINPILQEGVHTQGADAHSDIAGRLAASQSAAPPPEEAKAVEAHNSLDPASLAGTWQVQATATGMDTCNSEKVGSITSYQWIVNADPGGKVSISVLGNTSFPSLAGQVQGDELSVSGLLKDWQPLGGTGSAIVQSSVSFFELHADGSGLSGTRRYLGFAAQQVGDAQVGIVPCIAEYSVYARR